MRGSLSVTAHHSEDFGGRTGCVDGVLGGLEAVEVEVSVGVGAELSSEVVLGLVLRVMGVVLAVGAGLPHVEDGVGNSNVGVDVLDGAVEVGELSV